MRPNRSSTGKLQSRILLRPLYALAATVLLGSCIDSRDPVGVDRSVRLEPTASSAVIGFTSLNLVGDAVVAGDTLRLTPAVIQRHSAAWTTGQLFLRAGFETSFSFRFHDQGSDGGNYPGGADGLVLVVQNFGANALGATGGGIGYLGIPNSFAVEVDTWQNLEYGDPSDDHIGLLAGGSVAHPAGAPVATVADLEDGAVHTVRVRYRPPPGRLQVWLDASPTAVIDTAVDLGSLGALGVGGEAWVGLTSATGLAYQKHDVLSWDLELNRPPTASLTLPAQGTVGEPVKFSAFGSSDPDGDSLTYTFDFGDGAPQTTTDSVVYHTYTSAPAAGFDVELTVSDGHYTDAAGQTLEVQHEVTVEVTAPAGPVSSAGASGPSLSTSSVPGGVDDVTVTVTDVASGEFFVDATEDGGLATFRLFDGGYTFSARGGLNISDRTQLAVWPLGNVLASVRNPNQPSYTGVVFLGGGSAGLSPDNFLSAVLSPVTYGQSGANLSTIGLQLLPGATISCTLAGGGGGGGLQAYTVIPIPGDPKFAALPPPFIPAGTPLPGGLTVATALTLPRGIAVNVADVATDGTCSATGVGEGTTVIETSSQIVNGKSFVYRTAVSISALQAASGATVNAFAAPEPTRAFTDYLIDALGDGRRGQDIGLVTYGWDLQTASATLPGDDFILAADFDGLGDYTVHLRFIDPLTGTEQSIRATARCTSAGCELAKGTSRPLADQIEVSGTIDGDVGKIVWEVTVPGVSTLEFRLLDGQSGNSDRSPDSGFHRAFKKDGGGNTWIVAGVF